MATASRLPSAEEREGRRNRRHAWWTAGLAALVGLLIAVIGVGGAWVGTRMQVDSEDARSEREFLQTQRVQLYGEFLAQVDNNMALMGPYVPRYDTPENAYLDMPAPSSEHYSRMEEASRELDTLWGRIRLLSGAEVGGQAHMLQAQVQSMFHFAYNVVECHKDLNFGDDLPQILPMPDPEPGAYCTRESDYILESIDPYLKRQDFLMAAREELGTPD
jgi:hypothetical protein